MLAYAELIIGVSHRTDALLPIPAVETSQSQAFCKLVAGCSNARAWFFARRLVRSLCAMQFVNNVSFVIPNIYLIAVPCSWEAPIIGALASFAHL